MYFISGHEICLEVVIAFALSGQCEQFSGWYSDKPAMLTES